MNRYRIIAGRPIAAPRVAEFRKDSDPKSFQGQPEVAAPINAATQGTASGVRADSSEGLKPNAPVAAAPNELLALARSWDLWGGAALLILLIWLAVSSVFSLS